MFRIRYLPGRILLSLLGEFNIIKGALTQLLERVKLDQEVPEDIVSSKITAVISQWEDLAASGKHRTINLAVVSSTELFGHGTANSMILLAFE